MIRQLTGPRIWKISDPLYGVLIAGTQGPDEDEAHVEFFRVCKLETLRPMLAQSLDVIQVNGLCVVGTPVGPKDYVREYVRNSVAQSART